MTLRTADSTMVRTNPSVAINRQRSLDSGLVPSTNNNFYWQSKDRSLAAICQTLTNLTLADRQQKGWILVIAPPQQLTKQLLEQCQINCQRVLVINQKQIHHYDNLMRDALTCSTCQAVVSFLADEDSALSDYDYLANKYQTLLVNHAGHVRH